MAIEGEKVAGGEAKEIVRRRFRELDAGNMGILDELFSLDYVLNLPGRTPMGLEETKAFYEALYSAFPNLRHEIHDQIAEGDKVVTRWTARGTHESELMGIRPTGKTAEFVGINIYRLDGGKLVESYVCWDMLGLVQQLDDSIRLPR
jgi:steroid delta-isomerase-like uncharacterized protein